MTNSYPLEKLQKWFQSVITHPDGLQSGITSGESLRQLDVSSARLDQVILPSFAMSSHERLGIYGRAYFNRLIECLRAQFPAVRHAIGNEAFDGLAIGYLIQHPSTDANLGKLGDSFDLFLRNTRPPRDASSSAEQTDFADFLIDLAQLERIYSDVFHSHGPEDSMSLETTDFEGISAEEFASSRLIPHACVRLVEFAFPVHEYISSIRKDAEPILPPARPGWLVVTRRNYIVRRFEVSQDQFRLLSNLLIEKATIGQAIQKLWSSTQFNLEGLSTEIRTWFHDWSAAPLFSGIVHQ